MIFGSSGCINVAFQVLESFRKSIRTIFVFTFYQDNFSPPPPPHTHTTSGGLLGDAMVLGKLPVQGGGGDPSNLANRRTRAYCACSRCGWGIWTLFLLSIICLLSPYRLKYCLKRPLNPKQPTNPFTSYPPAPAPPPICNLLKHIIYNTDTAYL